MAKNSSRGVADTSDLTAQRRKGRPLAERETFPDLPASFPGRAVSAPGDRETFQGCDAWIAGPEAVPAGSRVRLQSGGRPALNGVLDEWMPDGSALWIWLDAGAGRKLIHEGDGVQVVTESLPHG